MWNGIQPTGAGQPLPVLQNPEPVACDECRGPTPFHPEPGRETRLRRGYWRFDRWETRYVRPTNAKKKPCSKEQGFFLYYLRVIALVGMAKPLQQARPAIYSNIDLTRQDS